MKKIYTRTGDAGHTSIQGGERVAKTDPRIEALGSLDELNVAVGIVRSKMKVSNPRQALLKSIQLSLMRLMGCVATPSCRRDATGRHFPLSAVVDLEGVIDGIAASTGMPDYFLLPGGDEISAFLHQARVAARRAERGVWHLNEVDEVSPDILKYINRLSDLFFMMARAEAMSAGIPEERWRLFSIPAGSGVSGCPRS